MFPQFSSSWPFIGVHGETTLSKITRLRRQINILRQRRPDFCLVELRKGVQRRRSRQLVKVNTHLEEDGDRFLAAPRPLPSPHFQHNTTNAPDVDLGVVSFLLAVDDFRCHPKDGPLHGRVGAKDIDIVRPLRDSEIRDFTKSGLLNEDVIRF